ncbi:hypothetical protein Ct61P_12417 [Colletotrichum tofieldiae]|nr:hypothetical protein Ct61P_12417 [Colletotrichum tofieldiae]
MTTSGTTPEIPDPLEIFSDHVIPDFDFNFLSEVTYNEQQQQLKEPSLAFEFIQMISIPPLCKADLDSRA